MGDNVQTTEAKLSPEAEELFNLGKDKYLVNGQLPNAPQFSAQQIQTKGQEAVAPLSANQNAAIGMAGDYANQSGVANYIDAAQQWATPGTGFSTGNFGANFQTGQYGDNFQTPSLNTNFTSGQLGSNPNFGANNVNLNDASGNSTVGQYNTGEISKFQNPYNDLVLGRGLDRLNEQRDKGYNALNSQVFGAGAFGGDRHGIAEATYMDRALQTQGDFIANQLQSGFTNAQQARMAEAGLAFQDQQADLAGETQRIGAINNAQGLGNAANLTQSQAANQALTQKNQVAQQRAGDQNSVQNLINQALGMQISADNNQVAQVNNARQQGMQNQLTLGAADQENVNNMLQQLTNTGAMGRDYDQSVLNMGRSLLQQDYQYPLSLAQSLGGFAPPPSTTTTAPNNPLSSIVPAAGALGSAAMLANPGFLSDERMKTDIKDGNPDKLAEEALAFVRAYAEDGSKTWKYLGDDEERTGPMTQDLVASGHGDVVRTVDGSEDGPQMVDVQSALDKLMKAVAALDRKVAA